MIKKRITQTLLTVVLGTSLVLAATMAPNTRMEKVRDLFTKYGADTFKILNGQDQGGTGSSESGKALQLTNRADIDTVIKPTDGNAFVFCIVDGKWAVYPPEPTKVGNSAMTATDSDGKHFAQMLITALRTSSTGKAESITYHVDSPGGKEKRLATVWNSRNLLSRKNDTGKKFFCGTSIKANDQD